MKRLILLAVVLALNACSPHGYSGHIDGFKASRSGFIFDLDGNYPNQKMVLFIPREYEPAMVGHIPRVGIDIQVIGDVTRYRGKPEIVVTSPDQLSW